jgi:hypothetical protein
MPARLEVWKAVQYSNPPLPQTPYSPNSPEHIHIFKAVSIALQILNDPKCRNYMCEMALEHDSAYNGRFLRGSQNRAFEAIDLFCRKVGQQFSLVLIRNDMQQGMYGCYNRLSYPGPVQAFDPFEHFINLNGEVSGCDAVPRLISLRRLW